MIAFDDKEWNYLKHPEKRPIPDMSQLKGSQNFLRQLYNQKNKEITIMPDYDTDGVTSGIYAYYGLQLLHIGTNVNIYFPDANDGFGVSPESVRKAMDVFPSTQVLLTTDNGISAIEGVKEANRQGLNVLITDHHEGLKEEPAALGIVNPNRVGDNYPFKGLSGAHVIHKVLWKYMETVEPDKKDGLEALTPLVGLSTVADIMPIQKENHTLLKQVLQLMNQEDFNEYLTQIVKKYPVLTGYGYGLLALLSALAKNKKAYKPYDESTFGWVISPMFNAPRRLYNKPDEAFKLFLKDDWGDAYRQAEHLMDINESRKDHVQEAVDTLEGNEIYQQFTKDPNAQSFQTAASHGIVGIISGRISNTYKVPTIVFSEPDGDGFIQGSGRSPEGVNLLEIVHKVHKYVPNIFKTYGGHAGACGVTIEASGWKVFEEYFSHFGKEAQSNQTLGDVQAVPVSFPDPYIKPYGKEAFTIEDTTDSKRILSTLDTLDDYAPFGQGFPSLGGVITLDLETVDLRAMGAKKNHLKIKMPFTPFEVIVWSDAQRILNAKESMLTIIFRFDKNEWNGRISLQGLTEDYFLHD